MPRKNRRLVFVILWCVIAVGCRSASPVKDARASLKGLRGLSVVIENLQPAAERGGLSREQLQTDVELWLRQAGIPVVSQDESLKAPGSPYLYVNINTAKTETLGLFATLVYAIQVAVRQDVDLRRDPALMVTATTWSTGMVGALGADNLQSVRGALNDLLKTFINDYLAENPK